MFMTPVAAVFSSAEEGAGYPRSIVLARPGVRVAGVTAMQGNFRTSVVFSNTDGYTW
jgi:hypothetical protein